MDNAFIAGEKLLRGNYSQYTLTGKSYFVKAGKYGKIPHKGDKVYFYSESMKRVAHVGVVTAVELKGNIYTIRTTEGNTSAGVGFNRNGGCVAEKTYSFTLDQVGGKNSIDGFGTPYFSDETCTVEEFIQTIKSEVGYIEKASNAELESKTANIGDKNYTKYGKWYAESCGGNHPAYWCEQFISYCSYSACKLHKEKKYTGWDKLGGKWLYQINGIAVRDKWLQIGGRWYAFDGAGFMIKSWFKSQDEWYYLNPADGAMLSGQWLKLADWEYYLTSSGAMAKSCYVRGTNNRYYWIDSEGHYDPTQDTREPDLQKYEVAS